MNTNFSAQQSFVSGKFFTFITAKDAENAKNATNYLCDLCALCGEINSAAHEVWYSGSGLKYDY